MIISTRNGRKSCSYVRLKSWESLIYYPMSPRVIPRHSVHSSCGRLKLWLITFNFDRFGAPPGSFIFFTKNFSIGCGATYNASRVIRTIWIATERYQTTHLWFCGTSTEYPRNGRKSCSYVFSKSWETLIYHPIACPLNPYHDIRCTDPGNV